MNMAAFGELLAELRLDRRLTQQKLADILHVSVGTISNYEKGIHFPDVEKLTDLTAYFGVTTDYLLGRTSYAWSLEELDRVIQGKKTVGGLVQDLQALSPERCRALLQILEDMKLAMSVEACQNRKELK